MKALPKSQILRFTEKASHLARRSVSRYSSKISKHRYTLPQHVVLICPTVRKDITFRGVLDELIFLTLYEHWDSSIIHRACTGCGRSAPVAI